MSLAPGTRLGPYELLGPIGAGGMGEVYRARDTRLGRVVAVKVLAAARTITPDARHRFEQEARAIASLNHPHICTIHDVGSQDEIDFLVMEYLEGETLASHLAHGPLGLDRALKYAMEIAAALDTAHRVGIIHRDLKPSNVMLTESGAKLLDFGLAKLHRSEPKVAAGLETLSPQALSLTGVIVGTLQYMSPEQVKGVAADARSDVFSFGAVLYEMVTREKAFHATAHTNLIGSILDAQPPPISTLNRTAPLALDRTVQKCLAKNPDERWQTMRDLLDELRWTAAPAPPVPGSRSERRRRVALVSVAAVAAVGLASAWLWLGNGQRAHGLSGQRLVTDYRGSHGWASFSPDGKMIAYVSDADGTDQVWIKNLASGDPIQLTFGAAGVGRAAWSPVGDQIVFGRAGAGIWSVPPLGGPPRRLLERGNRPKFSGDGRRLVFEVGGQIWSANADGSAARRVYALPPPAAASLPALSHDGASIVFFLTTGGGPLGDYWVVPSSGGDARQLTFDESQGGSAVWTPDGRSVVFPSARAGSMTLWQVAASGGTPQPLTFGAGMDSDPEISADGRRLVYTNRRAGSALALTDPVNGSRTEVLERQTHIYGATFAPAGDRLAFFYHLDSGVHVFTVRTDGSELRQITHAAGEVNTFPQWSGDGAFLYFFRQKPVVSFLKVSAVGGTATQLGLWSLSSHARVDPDGTRIVFERSEGGAAQATVIRELATGRETTLPERLRHPRWTRDGQAIIGTAGPTGADVTGQHIVTCAIDGPCRVLTPGNLAVPSADDSRIFFLRPDIQGPYMRELWSIARDGRDARQHGTLGPLLVGQLHYDVSVRDQIAWSLVHSGEHRIWLSELR